MQLIGRDSNFEHPLDGEIVDVDNGYVVVAMCPKEMTRDVAKFIEYKLALVDAQGRIREAFTVPAPVEPEPHVPWAWGPKR
jgi:hypothetical protein